MNFKGKLMFFKQTNQNSGELASKTHLKLGFPPSIQEIAYYPDLSPV